MQNRYLSLILSAASICVALCAANAQAQNPELGDVHHAPPPPPPEPARAPARNPFDRDVPVTGTDHSLVVGHLGIGWFGVESLPAGLMTGAAGGGVDTGGTLYAPSIGARYWLNENLGIEGAIGIGIQSGGTNTRTGTTTIETNEPSLFGMSLHAGLPLALAASQHFVFELIPEFNFGFVTGGRELGDNDADITGILLEVGARVGGEVHFGFIGIPQLALQGTVGLKMTYTGRNVDVGNVESSHHRLRFGTTVEGEPWDIFTGNIAASYYF